VSEKNHSWGERPWVDKPVNPPGRPPSTASVETADTRDPRLILKEGLFSSARAPWEKTEAHQGICEAIEEPSIWRKSDQEEGNRERGNSEWSKKSEVGKKGGKKPHHSTF